jgi:nitrile hydratase
MWAIGGWGARGPCITIDWFRHGLVCMVPSDYLSYRYFQKWCTNYFMLLIDNGTFTLEEVRSGHTERRGDPPPARTLEDALHRPTAPPR